jgi:hypothetical protein
MQVSGTLARCECSSSPRPERARAVVEKTSARFEQAGGSQAEVMARLAARTRGAPGDGLPPERILHYFLPRAFGEIAVDEMIDDVLRVGREFLPEGRRGPPRAPSAELRNRKQRCAAEIAAMPDAAQVVESLREWVSQRRLGRDLEKA